MEQQQKGKGKEVMKESTNRDRRRVGLLLNPPQTQPLECPRCDSFNTKFCYYNNYSLSQPRYYCKSCKRYWTQGGALRNVPVGGGCRKNSKSKNSSSSSSAAAAAGPSSSPSDLQNLMVNNNNLLLIKDQIQINQEIPNLTTTPPTITETPVPRNTSVLRPLKPSPMPLGIGSSKISLYYPSGRFLSSLAAFQSFNQPPPITINPGGDFGVSNLALLQGFSLPSLFPPPPPPPPQPQQYHHQIYQQSQIPNMDIRGKAVMNQMLPLDENMNQPNRPPISQQQAEWPARSFTNNSTTSDQVAGFWRSSSSSSTTGSTTALNPTHHEWSDHAPGCGGPVPTTSSSSPPPPSPPPPSML